MSKKSWLEKMGLVESQNAVDKDIAKLNAKYGASLQSQEEDSYVPEVTVDMGDADFLDVEEIYEKSNLSNKDRSIFKVDDFSKVLPESMTTDQKRQSVLGILAVNGLTVDELQSDAELRLGALTSVKETTTNTTNALIVEKETEINELLAKIDGIKQTINDRKLSQEHEDKLIKEEIERVSAIVKFITA